MGRGGHFEWADGTENSLENQPMNRKLRGQPLTEGMPHKKNAIMSDPEKQQHSGIGDMSTLFGVVKTLLGDVDLTPEERVIISEAAPCNDPSLVHRTRTAIAEGDDPLGVAYSRIRTAALRREEGITLTPKAVIDRMIELSGRREKPCRIVDAGAGTGRFTLATARSFKNCRIVAVEKNPALALILRANLIAAGFFEHVDVVVTDYREFTLPSVSGPTLFIGNPPYVRHHDIDPSWKRWYAEAFARFGIKASGLAGLHLHFFLKTMLLAAPGDIGCFITAAEWLDVGYGDALRRLLTKNMGCTSVHLIDKTVPVFDDALTSAVITCFEVGNSRREIDFHTMKISKGTLLTEKARSASAAKAEETPRWSVLVHGAPAHQDGMVELGDYFRVQRGQVTGMNEIWIAGRHSAGLPSAVLFPTVTRAQELITLPSCRLDYDGFLHKIIDLPADLSIFAADERARIERFLAWAMGRGADQTYIARHRAPWWRVNLRPPAPILMTYMGRRPPVFVRNFCGARHINIAHGLYPRETFPEADIERLVLWLNSNVPTALGRTYAGGLTKFEPGEAMRVPVPTFERLREMGRDAA